MCKGEIVSDIYDTDIYYVCDIIYATYVVLVTTPSLFILKLVAE